MPIYFTHFSCIFDVGKSENVARAMQIRAEIDEELQAADGSEIGFELQPDEQHGPTLWIHSGESGEPEHVIDFVLRCAATFELQGRWGFRWALTCSRPVLDAFGGGAQIINLGTRETEDWLDCEQWIATRLGASAAASASPTEDAS